MSKTISVRLDDQTYEALRRCAKAENRTLANFIATAARQHAEQSVWVDEAEMEEIRGAPELVGNLRSGSRAARERRGRRPVISEERSGSPPSPKGYGEASRFQADAGLQITDCRFAIAEPCPIAVLKSLIANPTPQSP